MGRPPLITDQEILRVAREVFLARGLHASTAEVAERAGISPGVLFKRFRTKAELFQAAMDFELETETLLDDLTPYLAVEAVDEALFVLAAELLGRLRVVIPLILMMWSNAEAAGIPKMLALEEPPPLRVLRRLTVYFEAEMDRGRLRRADAHIAARALLGTIWHFVMMQLLMPKQFSQTADDFLRAYIRVMLTGLAPGADGGADG